ncbi:MAG: hypothetical protein GQ583_11980 [Methyloprofundus sp.]|nr:hypothetical protein [Methyloprofundus sp.]
MSEFTTQALGTVAKSRPLRQQEIIANPMPVLSEPTTNEEAELVLSALLGITALINTEQQLMLFNF